MRHAELKRIDAKEREQMLAPLIATSRPWRLGNSQGQDAITKEFVFDTHADAMAFLFKIAMAAEVKDHHPDYSGSFNRVTITWTTHSCNGISAADVDMATYCDNIGPRM